MYTRHALAAVLLSVALAACLVPVGSEPAPDAIREEGEPGFIAQEIARTSDCKGLTPEACSVRCAEEGLHCISRRFHPTNKALAKGELIKAARRSPSGAPTASAPGRHANSSPNCGWRWSSRGGVGINAKAQRRKGAKAQKGGRRFEVVRADGCPLAAMLRVPFRRARACVARRSRPPRSAALTNPFSLRYHVPAVENC